MDEHVPPRSWTKLLVLHHREFALIGENGDIRFKYGCFKPHTRGPYCDRCGRKMVLPNGYVEADFAFNRPGIAYIECRWCGTRNTRPAQAVIT